MPKFPWYFVLLPAPLAIVLSGFDVTNMFLERAFPLTVARSGSTLMPGIPRWAVYGFPVIPALPRGRLFVQNQ